MGKTLVIVESPAKAKTINRYLGDDFVVKSSVGHVRDLPVSGGSKKSTPQERAKEAAYTRSLPKEEREASKAKAEKDRNAKKCLVCLQTFMISSKDKLLYDHVVANGA